MIDGGEAPARGVDLEKSQPSPPPWPHRMPEPCNTRAGADSYTGCSGRCTKPTMASILTRAYCAENGGYCPHLYPNATLTCDRPNLS